MVNISKDNINKELFEKWKNDGVALSIPTLEEFREFMTYIQSHEGIYPISEGVWKVHREETCINFEDYSVYYSSAKYYASETYGIVTLEDMFTPEKQTLKDMIQVGHRVTLRDGSWSTVVDRRPWVEIRDDNLKSTICKESDVMKIEIPVYKGTEPMTWKTIWEREEEELFYLRSYVTSRGEVIEDIEEESAKNYLNLILSDNTLYIMDGEDLEGYKTIFTQEEIDNLPNQKFISTLHKQPIGKGE